MNDQIANVYNMRVADYHTYFVGGAGWEWDLWAHNVTIPVMKGQDIFDQLTINRKFFLSAQSELEGVLGQYGRKNFPARSEDAYAVLRKYHILSKGS